MSDCRELDKFIAALLEELKWRQEVCEDFCTTPSDTLNSVLQAVEIARIKVFQ